jgi:benzoyl-CoA reductase subunit B
MSNERPPRPGSLTVTAAARDYSRQWFQHLRRRVIEERQPYVLCSAEAPHEIFETLGMPIVTTEWWSGVISAKKMAGTYFDWLARQGYHRGLGGYAAIGLTSLIADVPDPPWGGLPRPSLMFVPLRGDASEGPYAMVAARLGIPFVRLDVPASTRFYPRWWEMARREWEDLYEPHRVDVMAAQYRDLIAKAEAIVGRRLDIDRLRERVARVNRQEAFFDEARDIVCAAPKCPVRLSEQMSNTMTAQWHRGSDWALAHAEAFRDEVRARAAAGIAACPGERVRLMWMGVGLWQNTDFYSAFEESHGAVFVRSMYMSIAADGYIKHGLSDPVRALAARYLNLGEQMHIPPWAGAWAVHEAQRHRVHGAVMIVTPNLRHQLVGSKFQALALEQAGIPVPELEVETRAKP